MIHGDAADEGVALVADENFRSFCGEVAREAIAVADADGGDAGGSGGDEGASVGDTVSGGDGSDEGDAGFEAHDVAEF